MENRIKSSLAAAQAKLGTSREADDKKAEVEALTAISQLGYEQGKLAEIKSRQKMEETAQRNCTRKQGPAAQYPVQQMPRHQIQKQRIGRKRMNGLAKITP